MKYGYWLPVFGGWLRNVPNENMSISWEYIKNLAQKSEDWGYSLSLIAELYLNDIKGEEAPSLDAWSTAAALAAVTRELEIMVAVRPTYHNPALLAKAVANLEHISNDRISLNVVASWWKAEAEKYGIDFDQHDDRYARTGEWIEVVSKLWKEDHVTFNGNYYQVQDNVLQPKPAKKPFLYAGGESEAAKTMISRQCDGYVMHGDSPAEIGKRIEDMKRRREALGLPPMKFGVAAYAVVRDSEKDVKKEIGRITTVEASSASYKNYQQWVENTQLESKLSLQDYSVSNRGLRAGLAGTPTQVQDRIGEFEDVGVDFLLLQASPQLEEMERFSDSIISATN
ncbi:LLM class flavin-dependent oxidoreductase [Salinimicrobium sp. HB62]|uniref:LLM class flavin-dependent oxidoreductase n=1 Tax=Salinimicrobium sp. HB62 TaxID=3077781 RepID=UPI002D7830B3|nr:LLM class flavin-dependent oxidoreductase [Salinimicrobium sp. HB62]